MRIAYIGAGAAGTICANCLKDNALAAALTRLGHEVVLLPAYTPLLTDEEDVSDRRIVFGGINLYLQSRFSFFRNSGALDRLLDHPRLLGWASNFAVDTDPANLGAMTRDTFLGAKGPYSREMAKLMEMLTGIRPEIVHLTNSMLACMAEPVKTQFGVPVVCSLQGEAEFLNGLTEPHRSECRDLIRRHAENIDLFVPSCDDRPRRWPPFSATFWTARKRSFRNLDRRLRTASAPGVGSLPCRIPCPRGEEQRPGRIGERCPKLRRARPDLDVRLRVAGWRAKQTQPYIDGLRERFGFEDLGYLSRNRKIDFLRGLDAFPCRRTTAPPRGSTSLRRSRLAFRSYSRGPACSPSLCRPPAAASPSHPATATISRACSSSWPTIRERPHKWESGDGTRSCSASIRAAWPGRRWNSTGESRRRTKAPTAQKIDVRSLNRRTAR